jgi:hypothetical protein
MNFSFAWTNFFIVLSAQNSTVYWLGVKILDRVGCHNVLHQPILAWDFSRSVYFDGEKITTILIINF